MKTVGLVQPNFQTGPKHLNSWYLPYTLGCLWSYVNQYKDIQDNFKIHSWIFQRPLIGDAVEQLVDCDVIFCSMYMWNINYCYKLLRTLKRINPDIIIVAGGPEIPWRDKNFFNDHPYIDSIAINEGEQAALAVMRNIIAGEDLPKKLQFERIKELDQLPSPYLTGVFDSLIEANPGIEWVPTIETDRGCPFKCTYCDWGSATASKMYKFHMQRIHDEINWCADNNMLYFSFTASNFGAFKRDLEIADYMIDAKQRTGNPRALSASYAKNNIDAVYQIGRKLLDANIQNAPAASFQSTTPEVLKNIKRDNMKINSVALVTQKAKEYNLPIMTELIMGMPGETYDSWMTVIDTMLENNVVNLDIFYLQLIENAPMNVEDKETFGIETFRAYDYFYETTSDVQQEIDNGTAESINIISSSSTLTEKQMYDLSKYSWFVVGMHSYGISTLIADYLYKYYDIKYSKFYSDLMRFVQSDPVVNTWFDQHKEAYMLWKKTGYNLYTIGGYTIKGGWKGINSFMPIVQLNNYIPTMIDLVLQFVELYATVPSEILQDYDKLANVMPKQFGHYIHEPKHIELESNILDCLAVTVQDRYNDFPKTADEHMDWLFFGRRRNWQTNLFIPLNHK